MVFFNTTFSSPQNLMATPLLKVEERDKQFKWQEKITISKKRMLAEKILSCI